MRIGITQERALMVIKPPSDPRIATVFEINDHILVAIEQARIEHLSCVVGYSGIPELRVGVNRPLNEAAEEGCRRRSVKAMAVVKDPDDDTDLMCARL